ncbi:MAG: GNAT family N-acetyltransferase [Chitinophagaceae bacterium]|nr:GNAT family N-acetyltransferase [Oligoflexus sp.]
MTYYNPSKPEHFKARNALLQLCMRPDPLPFPVEQEYPIVLAEQGKEFSYCLNHNNRICSHANLWPRTVIDRQNREKGQIGLVGNVATDPSMQGRGHMRELLSNLEDIANRQNLDALVLWSDLDQFYHKLGYESVGQELHLGFAQIDPKRPSAKAFEGEFKLNGTFTEQDLGRMLQLRPQGPLTLARSIAEFETLLQIPWLDCFRAYRNGELVASILIGKGYDMVGVMHEWGAVDQTSLLTLIDQVATVLPYESLMLLVPDSLETSWKSSLIAYSESYEKHPMALIKYLTKKQKREDYSSLFVWGLDSI